MTSWKLIFFWNFFQRSSRLVKVMVKLWGGVSSILIEGVRSTFIQLLIFYWFYWFLSILLIFYRFYRFYWFFIDFIDFYRFYWFFYRFYWFLPILLIFQLFYPFLLIFWLVLRIFNNFSTSSHPYIGPISFWSAAWCTISTKSYCGGPHTTFGRIFGSWRGIKLKHRTLKIIFV